MNPKITITQSETQVVIVISSPAVEITSSDSPSPALAREAAALCDRLQESLRILRGACQHAAQVFRGYEKLHLAKDTEEGDAKAQANGQEAHRLEAVLAKT